MLQRYRNNASKDCANVFFFCHSKDLSRCFKKVCDDIAQTHLCNIYFCKSPDFPTESVCTELNLERMHLFLFSVTRNTFLDTSGTVQTLLSFAQRQHIPILPIVFDDGVDTLYENLFGDLQYLDAFSTDATAIKYSDKLRNYLNAVLLDSETIHAVQEIFDASVFLSYRKVDRVHANALMKLIHSQMNYRTIGVWFDEYISPGTSFNRNISQMLNKSGLFALIVTQNLLKKDSVGRTNYVMRIEYPEAQRLGKDIVAFAAEDVSEQQKCKMKVKGIPFPLDLYNNPEAISSLADILNCLSQKTSPSTPQHSFFLGLAYLHGINAEKDEQFALQMIEEAAQAGMLEAVKKLSDMYYTGQGVAKDSLLALKFEAAVVDNMRKAAASNEDILALATELLHYAELCLCSPTDPDALGSTRHISVKKAINAYREAISLFEGQSQPNRTLLLEAYESMCCLLNTELNSTYCDALSKEAIAYTQTWILLLEQTKKNDMLCDALDVLAQIYAISHKEDLYADTMVARIELSKKYRSLSFPCVAARDLFLFYQHKHNYAGMEQLLTLILKHKSSPSNKKSKLFLQMISRDLVNLIADLVMIDKAQAAVFLGFLRKLAQDDGIKQYCQLFEKIL